MINQSEVRCAINTCANQRAAGRGCVSQGRHTEGDTHSPAPAQALCEEEMVPPEDKEEQSPAMGAVSWTAEHRSYVMALSGCLLTMLSTDVF